MNTNIMANDGVPRVIITHDSVFTNSKCLFVEYYDVLKAPFFAFIQKYKHSEKMQRYFDFSSYLKQDEDMSDVVRSFNVYVCRRTINPLLSLPINTKEILKDMGEDVKDTKNLSKEVKNKIREWVDLLLLKGISENPEFYSYDYSLNFLDVLNSIVKLKDLIKRIIVYDEYDIENVKSDIVANYGSEVEYMSGNFQDVIKELPVDTTYVLSDIKKILGLKEENHLRLSSICLAESFCYNYTKDLSNYIIDLFGIYDNEIFKFNGFNNIN